MQIYDRIIIGAGIYGTYAAIRSSEKELNTLILETDKSIFLRGSSINQARVHNGYHYPRSFSTAYKSSRYFDRFMIDYANCINTDFKKIYAIANDYSWTNGEQFKKFSDSLGILCEEIDKTEFFNPVTIEKCFFTHEYTFDANLIKKQMIKKLEGSNCRIEYNTHIIDIKRELDSFIIYTNKESYKTKFILNATYASTNQIHEMMGFEHLPIKYELCEVIKVNVSDNIRNIGITVMDGPFFSLMPFGKEGYHSLTTVSRTPHITSYDTLPDFECQEHSKECTRLNLYNCNYCKQQPRSAFFEMKQIAKKYLREDINIEYVNSIFTIKPIMKSSEIDDSRPTVIRKYHSQPDFYTVFSGKINTIYDLDGIL